MAELTPEAKKLWEAVQLNSRKRASCLGHEWKRDQEHLTRWICPHCDSWTDIGFVSGYMQGLEHGRRENAKE